MASLRELARENIYDAAFGVCWFAIWKNGRSWNMESFYPEYDERKDAFKMDNDDIARIREILSEDYSAKFVNGYYCNIGTMEEMTVASLTDGLLFQYERGNVCLCDCI